MKHLIDKLAWIELKDGKILSTRSKGKDKYYIPGGKREAGETDTEALIREIQEELSVDLIPESVEYYGTFQAQAHGHEEGVFVQMTCYTAKFNGQLEAANEIEEIRWLNYSDQDIISHVDKLIFEDLKEKGRLD